jgi:hypothetical protein
MCLMCDGADLDDVLFRLDALVHTEGCALVEAPREGDTPNWIYTIGLTSLSQPELVLVGVDAELVAPFLDHLVDMVLAGFDLDAYDRFPDDGRELHIDLVDVHPSHVARGLIAFASRYYEAIEPDAGPPRARQIILPGCACHPERRTDQIVLDTASGPVLSHGPDRAVRRDHRRPTRRRR